MGLVMGKGTKLSLGGTGRQECFGALFRPMKPILVIVAGCLTACAEKEQLPLRLGDTALAASYFGLNGVTQGDSAAKVRAVLGAPLTDSAKFVEAVGDTVTTWTYKELSIDIIDGRVENLDCIAAPCRTPAGIALGDTVPKVIEVYGPADPLPNEREHTLLYVNGRSDCGITFAMERERVARIFVWCDRRKT